MRILGIETSCDETALALVEFTRGRPRALSNLVASQVAIHKKYGGVVPEVAAREHAVTMPLLLLELAGGHDGAKLKKWVDVIAVTTGPGLITSLRVGLNTARALSYAWNKKIIGVNHIEAHIAANWLKPVSEISNFKFQISNFSFPAVALVVSGGHTELQLMENFGRYRLLGATRDDAAGECFDKIGKMMGLPYPGGPALAHLAEKGDPRAFALPRPMIKSADLDFSFSGLKTAALYLLQKNPAILKTAGGRHNFAAAVETAIIDVLISKTVRATGQVEAKAVFLAGGVAANYTLRRTLKERLKRDLPLVNYIEPSLEYCTDNAAMIAVAGGMQAARGEFNDWRTLEADPNWELGRAY